MAASSSHDGLLARLTRRRPWLDRVLFGGALLGALVVVHLAIQQGRGFDRGCFGFAAPAHVEATFDCEAVVSSGAGTLLGVSNIVWGLGFYVAVAALSGAVLLAAAPLARRLRPVRAALVTGGVAYAGYLVYVQVAVLDALCALCLTSAAVATLLFALDAGALAFPRSSDASMSLSAFPREAARLAVLAVLALALAGADVAYFQRLDAPLPPVVAETAAAPGDATAARTPRAAASDAAPAPGDTLSVAEGCYYDPEKAPVEDYQSLVGFQDPYKGNASADVIVVEFFDPNCPACRSMHPIMKQAVDAHGDDAMFVYKPVPLWGYSVPQIEGLFVAAEQNKFFAMLDAQFARQQRGGLGESGMRAVAQAIGMDADRLIDQIQSGAYRPKVLQQREQAVAAGFTAAPTVLVNGRFVANQSRTPRCMSAFIEAAKADEG